VNSLKSITGLALACLAPVLVAAQEAPKATVTVYGTINVNLQYTEAAGATTAANNVKSRFAVSTDSSNIGVRAALKLSDMLGGVAQCESSAAVDGINAAGICGRNSRVGLTGAWGTLFYGTWDTPFKAVAYGTKADDPFMNTDVFSFQSMMGSPGFNYRSGGWSTASNTQIIGFDVRANNSVAYHSPSWNGVSAKLQYSANEFQNATGTQSPQLFAAGVNWDYGPFSVLAAYETHGDGFGLAGINSAAGTFGSTAVNGTGSATIPNSSSDSAWRVGAGYQLDSPAGATTIGALFEQLKYEQGGAPVGAVKEYKRTAWQVALKHRYGSHELRARYSTADAGDVTLNGATGSTTGYGASMYALGYAYYLTGALQAYVSYAKITNDNNARYTFSIGGSPAVAGATPAGADPSAVGLGCRFAF
jgi:predicted porin